MSTGAAGRRGSAADAREVSPELLRRTIGGFPTGVAIVTTKVGEAMHGMTVNSLTSVSLVPPLLLVCFNHGTRTGQAVEERGAFVVNLLSRRQGALSDRFAKPAIDHFEDVEVELRQDGLPVIKRTIGHLACDVRAVHPGGDHDIVVGEVVHCEPTEGMPLVFYRGRYHELSAGGREAELTWW